MKATSRAIRATRQEDTHGGWQRVQHRQRKLTYAQVVRSPPYPTRSPTPPRTIRAPNSPTTLTFPPESQLPEWRDRCFTCFRKGHVKAECTYPTRCAICWGQGHEYRFCPTKRVAYRPRRRGGKSDDTFRRHEQPPQPQRTNIKPTDSTYSVRKMTRKEPGFDELFKGDVPFRTALPDSERPAMLRCYIARDESFFTGVDALHNAVIVTAPSQMLDQVTTASVASSLSKAAGVVGTEFKVSTLSASRFLVEATGSADIAHCASLLPEEWWEQGFKVERWSPMIGAGVEALSFKVWLELLGLPPHLRREEYVAHAASRFGVYLGTVPNHDERDLTSWAFVVAVPDLRKVPMEVLFTAGALEYKVRVVARRWVSTKVYGALDFPKLPEKILPPSARSPVVDITGDSLTIKLHDLEKIFRHVPRGDLPADIRAVMAEKAAEGKDARGKALLDKPAVVELLRRDLSVIPTPAQEVAAGLTKGKATATGAATVDQPSPTPP